MRKRRRPRGPRFSRARPDATRHRSPGRARDRSGTAAFLSPLRAWPVVRHPGQARVAQGAAARGRAQSTSPADLAAAMTPGRRTVPATLSAQLIDRVTLATDSGGSIVASLQDYSVALGKFSAGAGKRVRDLRGGLPLSALTSAAGTAGEEKRLLLRR